MLAHDALIFLAPLLLDLVELGLADHFVDARAEMARHAAGLADPLAGKAHCARQILGRNDSNRHRAEQQQLLGIDVEHASLAYWVGRSSFIGCKFWSVLG